MSTEIIAGWLKDNDGNKFSPKTLVSQVINDDGTPFNPANVKKANPYNYLDNSNFRNPVNQRNFTAESMGGYFIDRWIGYKVLAGNHGLTFHVTTDINAHIVQKIEPNLSARLVGKVLTLAAKFNGEIQTYSFTYLESGDNEGNGKGLFKQYINGLVEVGFAISDGGTLEWMALYEGEYTEETLPAYHPKGFAHELLECQRYYVELDHYALGTGYSGSGGDVTIFINVPIQMRAVPRIICDGAIRARYGGTAYYTLDNCGIAAFDRGYSATMRLIGYAISGISTYQVVAGYAESKFALSAEL